MAPSKKSKNKTTGQKKGSLDEQKKLLHSLVEELAGVDTGRIVEILFRKKDVNEFLVAKKMELTINQVRNILYKLSNHGLVSFIRKKDKRKGWYIYYWTLNTEKCLVLLEQSLIRKIEELRNILNSRETKRFYICKPCNIELSEEKALEHGFSCEECAEVYELSDNSGPIRDTKARITRTEKDLGLILTELESIREKEEKKRQREDKKREKEEAEKKALIKKARAMARAKLKGTKKKVSKKPTKRKNVSKKAGSKKKKASKKSKSSKKKSPKKTVVKKLKKIVKKVRKKKK